MDVKDMEVTFQQVKSITQKPKIKMNKTIIKTAESYQKLDRQIKELEAKKAPLKEQLLSYANEHKADFDQAFQLKFPNGTYIVHRVKDCIEGSEDKSRILETYPEFGVTKLDEAAIVSEAVRSRKLRKFLTSLGFKLAQKETLAVYAS